MVLLKQRKKLCFAELSLPNQIGFQTKKKSTLCFEQKLNTSVSLPLLSATFEDSIYWFSHLRNFLSLCLAITK